MPPSARIALHNALLRRAEQRVEERRGPPMRSPPTAQDAVRAQRRAFERMLVDDGVSVQCSFTLLHKPAAYPAPKRSIQHVKHAARPASAKRIRLDPADQPAPDMCGPHLPLELGTPTTERLSSVESMAPQTTGAGGTSIFARAAGHAGPGIQLSAKSLSSPGSVSAPFDSRTTRPRHPVRYSSRHLSAPVATSAISPAATDLSASKLWRVSETSKLSTGHEKPAAPSYTHGPMRDFPEASHCSPPATHFARPVDPSLNRLESFKKRPGVGLTDSDRPGVRANLTPADDIQLKARHGGCFEDGLTSDMKERAISQLVESAELAKAGVAICIKPETPPGPRTHGQIADPKTSPKPDISPATMPDHLPVTCPENSGPAAMGAKNITQGTGTGALRKNQISDVSASGILAPDHKEAGVAVTEPSSVTLNSMEPADGGCSGASLSCSPITQSQQARRSGGPAIVPLESVPASCEPPISSGFQKAGGEWTLSLSPSQTDSVLKISEDSLPITSMDAPAKTEGGGAVGLEQSKTADHGSDVQRYQPLSSKSQGASFCADKKLEVASLNAFDPTAPGASIDGPADASMSADVSMRIAATTPIGARLSCVSASPVDASSSSKAPAGLKGDVTLVTCSLGGDACLASEVKSPNAGLGDTPGALWAGSGHVPSGLSVAGIGGSSRGDVGVTPSDQGTAEPVAVGMMTTPKLAAGGTASFPTSRPRYIEGVASETVSLSKEENTLHRDPKGQLREHHEGSSSHAGREISGQDTVEATTGNASFQTVGPSCISAGAEGRHDAAQGILLNTSKAFSACGTAATSTMPSTTESRTEPIMVKQPVAAGSATAPVMPGLCQANAAAGGVETKVRERVNDDVVVAGSAVPTILPPVVNETSAGGIPSSVPILLKVVDLPGAVTRATAPDLVTAAVLPCTATASALHCTTSATAARADTQPAVVRVMDTSSTAHNVTGCGPGKGAAKRDAAVRDAAMPGSVNGGLQSRSGCGLLKPFAMNDGGGSLQASILLNNADDCGGMSQVVAVSGTEISKAKNLSCLADDMCTPVADGTIMVPHHGSEVASHAGNQATSSFHAGNKALVPRNASSASAPEIYPAAGTQSACKGISEGSVGRTDIAGHAHESGLPKQSSAAAVHGQNASTELKFHFTYTGEEIEPFSCMICQYRSATMSDSCQHVCETHGISRHETRACINGCLCPGFSCEQVLPSPVLLIEHVSSMHASDSEAQSQAANLVQCDFCRAHVALGRLVAHVASHVYDGFYVDINRIRAERGKPPVKRCISREQPNPSVPGSGGSGAIHHARKLGPVMFAIPPSPYHSPPGPCSGSLPD